MTTAQSQDARFLKRFRMEIDLSEITLDRPHLPEGYAWAEWHPAILHAHALAKYDSFHEEMDSQIFPALRTLPGCRELMLSITKHSGFLPQATWLIQFEGHPLRRSIPCATIQGLTQSTTLGAIQNVGVIPEHRGFGLGRALLLKNLLGFRAHGLLRVYLDVSADNVNAIALYRSVGFKYTKTSYREILPQ